MPEAAAKTRSIDPRVATAIAHWAPRFVSNGVLLADFEEVTAGIERWEDWCRAWCDRGKVHETLGREALAQGYKLTAGEHLVRAAMYYHFAKFVFVHDQKQMRDAHLRSVECYNSALPLMRPTGERVSIPFEGKTLYGILRHPLQRSTRSPVLIMAPGLDSTKEELHAYAEPFLARGVAARAVGAWIEKPSDLDAAKIAMGGVSLGGYYAPRATAYERRIRACIALSGPFEWKEIWGALPALTREAFRVRSHCTSEADALKNAATLSMKEAAAKIACPIFIVTGREDRLVP